MEYLEHSLRFWAQGLKLILEGISLLCILLGLVTTVQFLFSQDRRSRRSVSSLANIRLNFGRWLSIALEFQLGADIVNTTVAPTFDALGKLALIAVIRTFLNYFLSKELAEEIKANQTVSQPPVNIKES